MTGWRTVHLGDLGTVERGRSRHRPRNAEHLYGGPHPFVQTGDIKAAGLRLFKYEQTYSDAGLAQSRLWPAGTLCITIAANIGDTTILGLPACFPDSIVGFTPFEGVADTVFVKYLLDYAKQRFQAISHGATQDNLSLDKLTSQPLSVPRLETQCRIASILGAYDDLIEVNRRRVALLEGMARGLFEEWFVRLRFPGHEAVSIVHTPEGPLPSAWQFKQLDALAEINTRSLRPASAPDHIGYIDIASVSPGQVDAVNWMDFSDAPGRARRCVSSGSILWSNVRPNRRSFALLIDPDEAVVVSTGFTVIDARDVPFSYLYCHLSTDAFVAFLVGRATGAAYPAVTASVFNSASVMVPDDDTLTRFDALAAPSFRLADTLRKANGRLAASRDLLLPRLISGQLSISVAERELEQAA